MKLLEAIEVNNITIIRKLLGEGKDTACIEGNDKSALQYLFRRYYSRPEGYKLLEIAILLVQHGADVNTHVEYMDKYSRATTSIPLVFHVLAFANSGAEQNRQSVLTLLELCIAKRVNLEVSIENGITPLAAVMIDDIEQYAQAGQIGNETIQLKTTYRYRIDDEIARMFVNAGANCVFINPQSKKKTALHCLCQRTNIPQELFSAVLENQTMSVNQVDETYDGWFQLTGMTALSYIKDDFDATLALLQRGAQYTNAYLINNTCRDSYDKHSGLREWFLQHQDRVAMQEWLLLAAGKNDEALFRKLKINLPLVLSDSDSKKIFNVSNIEFIELYLKSGIQFSEKFCNGDWAHESFDRNNQAKIKYFLESNVLDIEKDEQVVDVLFKSCASGYAKEFICFLFKRFNCANLINKEYQNCNLLDVTDDMDLVLELLDLGGVPKHPFSLYFKAYAKKRDDILHKLCKKPIQILSHVENKKTILNHIRTVEALQDILELSQQAEEIVITDVVDLFEDLTCCLRNKEEVFHIVKALVQNAVVLNELQRDKKSGCILAILARQGSLSVDIMRLLNDKVNQFTPDDEGMNIFHLVVSGRQIDPDLMNYLLDMGDLDKKQNSRKQIPLECITESDSLLHTMPDRNQQDSSRLNQVLTRMIGRVSIDYKIKNLDVLLVIALQYKNTELTTAIISRGYDLATWENPKLPHPVIVALMHNNIDIFQRMVSLGKLPSKHEIFHCLISVNKIDYLKVLSSSSKYISDAMRDSDDVLINILNEYVYEELKAKNLHVDEDFLSNLFQLIDILWGALDNEAKKIFQEKSRILILLCQHNQIDTQTLNHQLVKLLIDIHSSNLPSEIVEIVVKNESYYLGEILSQEQYHELIMQCAIKYMNVNVLKKLVENKFDINKPLTRSIDGTQNVHVLELVMSPLISSKDPKLEATEKIISALVAYRFPIVFNSEGCMLYKAAHFGFAELLGSILDEINRNNYSLRPECYEKTLLIAIKNGKENVIRLFIERQLMRYTRMEHADAAIRNKLPQSILNIILKELGKFSSEKKSLIHVAIEVDYQNAFQLLISMGAKCTSDDNNYSPIMYLLSNSGGRNEKNLEEWIELLLNANSIVDIDLLEQIMIRPIPINCMTKIFNKHQYKLNLAQYALLLNTAIIHQNHSAVKFILSIVGDEKSNLINYRFLDGRTIIFQSLLKHDLKMFEYLKENGADLAVVDSHNFTLAHYRFIYNTAKDFNLAVSGLSISQDQFNLLFYKLSLFDEVKNYANRETELRRYCYLLIALFDTAELAYQYIDKFMLSYSRQPIHDLSQFSLPSPQATWSKSAWVQLAMQHQNDVTKYLTEADRIEEKLNHPPASLQELISCYEQLSYKCANDAPVLAKLYREYNIPEIQFTRVLKLPKKEVSHIVPIDIDGLEIGFPGYRYIKLADNDERLGLLGDMTGCCQTLGKAGEPCAWHGMTSPYGGFYALFDAKSQVLGQLVLSCVENKNNFPTVLKTKYKEQKNQFVSLLEKYCCPPDDFYQMLKTRFVKQCENNRETIGLTDKKRHKLITLLRKKEEVFNDFVVHLNDEEQVSHYGQWFCQQVREVVNINSNRTEIYNALYKAYKDSLTTAGKPAVQSWVWIGVTGRTVIDSWEPGISDKNNSLCRAFLMKAADIIEQKTGLRPYIGAGGRTPGEIFKTADQNEVPKDYCDYRDSKSLQYELTLAVKAKDEISITAANSVTLFKPNSRAHELYTKANVDNLLPTVVLNPKVRLVNDISESDQEYISSAQTDARCHVLVPRYDPSEQLNGFDLILNNSGNNNSIIRYRYTAISYLGDSCNSNIRIRRNWHNFVSRPEDSSTWALYSILRYLKTAEQDFQVLLDPSSTKIEHIEMFNEYNARSLMPS